MAKKNRNNDDNTVVNIAAPGSVVGDPSAAAALSTPPSP
ncbi:hypothetical protein SANTM175S_02702 [Streptomyces antimycoticus]